MNHRADPRGDFEPVLTRWLDATAPEREPDDLLERVLDITAATRRRPAWWRPNGPLASLAQPRLVLTRTLGAAAIVALLSVAVLAAVGIGSRPEVPLPLGHPGFVVAATDGALLLLDDQGTVLHRLPTGDFFGEGTWSAGGSRLARVSGTTDAPVLLITDANLSEVARVALPAGTAPRLSWSPDGRQLAFFTETDTDARVWVVDAKTGSVPVAITNHVLHAIGPSWSPDGAWIAVRSGVALDQQALSVIRPDGTDLRRLSQSARAVEAYCNFSWSPDAGSIVFGTRYNGVWMVAADGSNERSLVGGAEQAYCPSMSPDGTRVALMNWQATGKFIEVLRLADGRRVTPPGPIYDSFPAVWSPDGRSLVTNGRDLTGGPRPLAFLDPDAIEPARIFHLEDGGYVVGWQRLAP